MTESRHQSPDIIRPQEYSFPQDIERVRREFRDGVSDFFRSRGYEQVKPQPLVPQDDPTILFTNSAIASMKPYMAGEIPTPSSGFFVDQPCVRTQNLAKHEGGLNDFTSEYLLYFRMFGAYASPEQYGKFTSDTWALLCERLQIKPEDIAILADQSHQSLLDPWKNLPNAPSLELNTQDADFYNWSFGLEGVLGKGLTIAMKRKDTIQPAYIANVIEVYNRGEIVGYGLGIGEEVYLAAQHHLKKPLAVATISRFVEFDDGPKAILADLLSLAVAIYRAQIRPGRGGREHLAKITIKKLSDAVSRLGISMHECRQIIDRFEEAEFGTRSNVGEDLIRDLKTLPFGK